MRNSTGASVEGSVIWINLFGHQLDHGLGLPAGGGGGIKHERRLGGGIFCP